MEKIKHFPSSTREWNNSVYSFNKNMLDLIPSSSANAMFLIKNYFNFFSDRLEKKMRSKRLLLRFRRLTSNKIYFSNAEFKHTNNKVLINLYIFNRQRLNYFNRLRAIFFNNQGKRNFEHFFIESLKNAYKKGFSDLKKLNKNNYLLTNIFSVIESNKDYKIENFKFLNNYSYLFYRKLLFFLMKKYRLLFFYKQLIYLNESKINYTYLRVLKKYLEILYNKNVEFNLINLKRFYLNSDILTESVKLKITKNKKNLRKVLKKVKDKIKIQKKVVFLGFKPLLKNQSKVNFLLNNLKYRHVTGFRLQAKGRLTRRYTASRSLGTVKYAGNLLNIDSSYRGMSSVLLKGNLKSNIQYSRLHSKTRIGSFGLKGWVSGN